MLATWLSYADLARLMQRCVLAEKVGLSVIWGASHNARMTWWGKDDREKLGWAPQDSADAFAGQLAGKLSDSPVAERYQGGGFTAMEYSRKAPVPPDPSKQPSGARAKPVPDRPL
jgi:uronate dehydrogenase